MMSASRLYFGSIARSSVIAENLPLWSMRTLSAVLLGDVQLDPAAALGNDAAAVQLALAALRLLDDEVDAGAAVQLADHDALGAVDDELAAAEHDRHIAQVDFFLDRLLLVEPQPDAERPAVGQPQLAAFVRLVARLAQLVAQVLELERLVVALDREDLAQHAFEAVVLALVGGRFVLQERCVAVGLDLRQIGNRADARDRCRSGGFRRVCKRRWAVTAIGRAHSEVKWT